MEKSISLRSSSGADTSSDCAKYGDILLVVTLVLVSIGLVMVYASSALRGIQNFSDEFSYFRKQVLMSCVAVVGGSVLFLFSESMLKRLTLPLLAGSLVLLGLIFVPGLYDSGGGAERWIQLFGLRFQTSEIAKLALIFFIAKWLSHSAFSINQLKSSVFPLGVVICLICVLLMQQPDFGSSILFLSVTMAALFTAGLNGRYLMILFVFLTICAVVAICLQPYRLARVASYLDPWNQAQTGGFQIIQSYLAFHNGGFFGAGLGESKQKLFFLPEAHTDFIISVIGEELGLFGIALVIALFLLYFFVSQKIAALQVTPFRKYLVQTASYMITFQACINLGVAMGVLPTKGIPLPFLSSGGMSMVTSIFLSLLIVRLSRMGPAHSNQLKTAS
jgi:cell division protein FtsW